MGENDAQALEGVRQKSQAPCCSEFRCQNAQLAHFGHQPGSPPRRQLRRPGPCAQTAKLVRNCSFVESRRAQPRKLMLPPLARPPSAPCPKLGLPVTAPQARGQVQQPEDKGPES